MLDRVSGKVQVREISMRDAMKIVRSVQAARSLGFPLVIFAFGTIPAQQHPAYNQPKILRQKIRPCFQALGTGDSNPNRAVR
jgi:hypothetical protein